MKELEDDREKHLHDQDPTQLWLAFMDLWNATGASAVPMDKVEEQRKTYFADVHFSNIEEYIQTAEKENRII